MNLRRIMELDQLHLEESHALYVGAKALAIHWNYRWQLVKFYENRMDSELNKMQMAIVSDC